jgi:two-component system phosphate regulon sensor histidine kinase PhoR
MTFPRLAWRLRWALLAPVAAAVLAALPLVLVGLFNGPPAKRDLVVTLGLAAVVGIAAAAGTAWWLRRVLVAPLDQVLAGVERLAGGDFAFRLPASALPEITTLSERVNGLAERFGQEVARQAETADEVREILEALPDGVLVVREGGRTAVVNRAFYQLMRTGSVLADAPVFEAVRHPAIRELVGEAMHSPDIVERSLELDDTRGQRRFLVARGRILPRRDAVVVVVRDVTEAARVDAMRRDFVANLSHELKTPLSAVRGYAESLEDGALADPELARRFLAGILTSTGRLEALLADLLTLARMEGVGITEVLEEVDLGELVHEVVDAARPRIESRGLDLNLDLATDAILLGDRKALERMVSNLVENAIAYNRENGSIAVRLVASDAHFAIEVEDRGMGIPAAALPRIFERFYRVDRGRTRAEGGTGLGLSIVRHAALRHGGSVEVSSREGVGSTFRVTLPRRVGVRG